MTTKRKEAGTRARRPRRAEWIWGDSKKGIRVVPMRPALVGGGYGRTWDVHHVKDGKVFLVHRDFSKTEAIKQAKGYGRYEETHPRHSFFKDYSRYARKQK